MRQFPNRRLHGNNLNWATLAKRDFAVQHRQAPGADKVKLLSLYHRFVIVRWCRLEQRNDGGCSSRSDRLLLVQKTVPRVRIPLAPPHSLKCREIRLDCSGNCRKWAQFRNSCSQPGPEKVSCSMLQASFAAIFSGGHPSSPVSKTPSGECNAITNR